MPTEITREAAPSSQRVNFLAGDLPAATGPATFDAEDRLSQVTYRDGSQMSFSGFDTRNMPELITLPGSGSMTVGYDKLGRPRTMSTSFPAAGYSGGSITTQETAKYDALDRVREQGFGANGMTFTYDLLGVMTRTTLSYQGRSFEWRSAPNAAGSKAETLYPSGVRVTLGRDVGQRLRSMTDVSSSPAGEAITAEGTYATPEKLGRVKLGPSGLLREDAYDARQRLLSRVYRTEGPGAQVVAELRYAYDGADREVARQHGHRGHRTDLYVYDAGGRLVRADLAARLIHPENLPLSPFVHGWDVGPSVAPQISAGSFSFGDVLCEYGFDATGKDHLESVLSTTYDGPGAGPAVAPVASSLGGEDALGFLTVVDGFTRTRDALGNATRIETRPGGSGPEVQSPKAPLDLVFDAHSRLRRATRQDGVRVEYEYRADGVLLARRVICGATPPAGCVDTHRLYLYEGMLLLEERELGASTSQDVLMARYYYAEEGDIPVAGDFRMGPGPNDLVRLYYVVDRQGSVLGLVDEGGAWVERVRYDVWGTPVFEAADLMAPEVSRVGTDPVTGDVVIVMSEPVVPRAVPPMGPNQTLSLEAIDLSSEMVFEDELGQEVPGRVTVDLDSVDDTGVPVGSVLRWTPLAAVAVGALLTLRVAEGAVVDDHGLRNAVVAQSVTYGPAQSYAGPAPGSTQASLQNQSLVGNRLLFQSHFWDGDVGLYHMRARMFDPRSGTFLSRDPSGYVDSVNLYAPMRWDVVSLRDPTGRSAMPDLEACIARGIPAEDCERELNPLKPPYDPRPLTPAELQALQSEKTMPQLRLGAMRWDEIAQANAPQSEGERRDLAIRTFFQLAELGLIVWSPGPRPSASGARSSGRALTTGAETRASSVRAPAQGRASTKPPEVAGGTHPGTTRLGVRRTNPADWRVLRDAWDRAGVGDILSAAHRQAIAGGRTPIVDDAWIRYFPGDEALRGEKIVMHHIGGTPITVPLPASRHLDAHMPGGFRRNPGGPGTSG